MGTTIVTESTHYPANVFWSEEDEGFIAEAIDLPGCSAFGENQAEAIAELQHAIAAWTEAAKAAGNRVPEPSRPAAERHSGKVLLRMPRSLHAELVFAAKRDDVSLNQYVVYLITKRHFEREASNWARSQVVSTLDHFTMKTAEFTKGFRLVPEFDIWTSPNMPVISPRIGQRIGNKRHG